MATIVALLICLYNSKVQWSSVDLPAKNPYFSIHKL